MEQRSARGMTSAMWNLAQKWKPRLRSRRLTIIRSSVLPEVSTDIAVDTSSSIGWLICSRHSTAAVYRPIVDWCLVQCYIANSRLPLSPHLNNTHFIIHLEITVNWKQHLGRLLPVLNVQRLFTAEVSSFSEVSTWRSKFPESFSLRSLVFLW